MKNLLLYALVVIVFFGCEETNKKINTDSDLPIDIGQSKMEVQLILGTPTRTGDYFDSFFNHGLIVYYNNRNQVSSIKAAQLHSGIAFSGKILGVSIGDHLSKCMELWGNNAEWEELEYSVPAEYSKVVFYYDRHRVDLEVWSRDGIDDNFGYFENGTIKSITISK
ncbi:hypothetical protein [Rhodohalobacter mucosus]|uniref:Uncharacterized protein n=1 Tax=Rhodohalobacter mucosus TaxID=2079485 RepID=A0A316TNC3_9BACT|nr:hypothetical protein [Rhodohalobacter mucosus]PWN06097.1 hypothetical protein DDZ15_09595 [Rhodohalobacter mucosus]